MLRITDFRNHESDESNESLKAKREFHPLLLPILGNMGVLAVNPLWGFAGFVVKKTK
jgi:hypothetical protein